MKRIRITREATAKTPDRREEPMSEATFRGCVSMAIWLVALCIAVLTVAVLVRGWPGSSNDPTPEVSTVAPSYVAIPPCGWSQVSASSPEEPSVSVSVTCPSVDEAH